MSYSGYDDYGHDVLAFGDVPPEIPPGVEFFSSLLESTYCSLSNLRAEVRKLKYESEIRSNRHKTKVQFCEEEIRDLEQKIRNLEEKAVQQVKNLKVVQDNLENAKENNLISLGRLTKLEASEAWYREAFWASRATYGRKSKAGNWVFSYVELAELWGVVKPMKLEERKLYLTKYERVALGAYLPTQNINYTTGGAYQPDAGKRPMVDYTERGVRRVGRTVIVDPVRVQLYEQTRVS